MGDILKFVNMVYNYDPSGDLEKAAFCELVGGETVYNMILKFKEAGAPPEQAVDFMNSVNNFLSIQDLLI